MLIPSYEQKRIINSRKVIRYKRKFYESFQKGEIGENYLERLAEAFNVFDQYKQVRPSLTTEEIKSILREKGLLKNKEGILMAEAAYLFYNSKEYYAAKKRKEKLEEIDESLRQKKISQLEKEMISDFLDHFGGDIDSWGGIEEILSYINPD